MKVIAPETRPALQGARLTAYELMQDGFDVTLVADSAVGYVLSRGLVDKVIVGADRVTKTGHVFNKIGTYSMAVLAHRHRVPFYVAAPVSSVDPRADWREVVVEERGGEEVEKVAGKRIAPRGVKVFNPVFDVTPPELVAAIVTDRGVLQPPYDESIERLFARG